MNACLPSRRCNVGRFIRPSKVATEYRRLRSSFSVVAKAPMPNTSTAELIRTLQVVWLPTKGTSMVPAIHPGDLLCVKRVDLGEVSRGDVIVYARQGRLIVHRVVVTRTDPSCEPFLITRGDRSLKNDVDVLSSELVGLVIMLERDRQRRSLGQHLSPAERAIRCLLCSSDWATYFYLRLSALCRKLYPRRSRCET